MSPSRFHEHLTSDHDSVVDSPLPSPPLPTRNGADRVNVMAQIHAAMTPPTPLSELLRDPAFINALDHAEGKKSRRQSSSSHHHREPRHSGSSVMGLVLAEQEKQSHNLRSVLRSTGDRLNQEMRRADQLESKAEFAERRVQELTTRVNAAEMGKRYAELDATRANEEVRRHQMRIENLEREVRQLQADIRILERKKNEAEESATRARDTARKFQIELSKQQARDEEIEENQMYGSTKWFAAGHTKGFDDGRDDGFEEGRQEGLNEGQELGFKRGRKAGWKDGFENGRKKGRQEEYESALLAFNELIATETDEDDYTVSTDLSSQYFIIDEFLQGPKMGAEMD